MQITYYATESVGLSAGLIGTLLLVSKLFDGVTDLYDTLKGGMLVAAMVGLDARSWKRRLPGRPKGRKGST